LTNENFSFSSCLSKEFIFGNENFLIKKESEATQKKAIKNRISNKINLNLNGTTTKIEPSVACLPPVGVMERFIGSQSALVFEFPFLSLNRHQASSRLFAQMMSLVSLNA
jgi:hypothetical protein